MEVAIYLLFCTVMSIRVKQIIEKILKHKLTADWKKVVGFKKTKWLAICTFI